MREVCIIGAGMTKFGKFYNQRLIEDLGAEASAVALKHAGVNHTEIEAVYSGNSTNHPNAGQRIMDRIGVSGIPVYNQENACASSAIALREAWSAVGNGIYNLVLVVGSENMTTSIKGLIEVDEWTNLLTDMGMVMPCIFAFLAHRHMEEYGTTKEQLAKISVKNHKNGTLNPFAQHQKECTLEGVLHSRMICDPLTLLQCCPIGDGAAAAVVCDAKTAKKHTTKPVKIAASAFVSSRHKGAGGKADRIDACVRASQQAYEKSGLGPEDLDVIELHDCFTSHELLAYEDLGLCKKGEGGRMIDKGETELDGRIPVNPSGGLLSKGHPIGATGLAQMVELVWQLRGEAGKRQVKDAKVALAHNGGGWGGSGIEPGAMSITILTR